LIASFSDGMMTSSEWKSYVMTEGPTEESEQAGCSSNNLDAVEIVDYGEPSDWFSLALDFSPWEVATGYTAKQAGWGRPPTWVAGAGCCTATSSTMLSPPPTLTLKDNNNKTLLYNFIRPRSHVESRYLLTAGLVACLIDFEGSEFLHVAPGVNTPFSFQWLAHTFQSAQRLAISIGVVSSIDETYVNKGLSHWVNIPHKIGSWLSIGPRGSLDPSFLLLKGCL
jgi:hypothetical protein